MVIKEAADRDASYSAQVKAIYMLVFINDLMAPAFIMPVISKERSINLSYFTTSPFVRKKWKQLGLFRIVLFNQNDNSCI